MYKLLKYREVLFNTRFESIYYCIFNENLRSSQPFIQELKAICPNLEVIAGLPSAKVLLRHPLPKLFFLDDMHSELRKNAYIQTLFTRDSRHENASIIVSSQQYFDINIVIRNNANYKVIFNDPTSDQVIRSISSQLKYKTANTGASFLGHCFETYKNYFPQNKHPYLVIDSDYGSGNDETRIRTDIFPKDDVSLKIEPIVFYRNYNL